VCLSVCPLDYSNSYKRTLIKFFGEMGAAHKEQVIRFRWRSSHSPDQEFFWGYLMQIVLSQFYLPAGNTSLLQVSVNCRGVGGVTLRRWLSSRRCDPKMLYLSSILAQHLPRKWHRVSSYLPQANWVCSNIQWSLQRAKWLSRQDFKQRQRR